jgi:DNA-binding FadR family transcriptional regulator
MRGQQGRVIEALGADIVAGRYPPGVLLPKEAELEAEYGVSRTSVREAMRVLGAKGLVEIRRRYGTSVRDREMWSFFDSDILRWHAASDEGDRLLHDLIELRQVLEPAAARLAAVRADLSDLHRLEVACSQMAADAELEDGLERYAASDVDFHMAVYAASHNLILQRFGRLVAEFMQLAFCVQQSARSSKSGHLRVDAKAHLAVFDAINRSDPNLAAEAILSVVLDGKSALIEARTGTSGHKQY